MVSYSFHLITMTSAFGLLVVGLQIATGRGGVLFVAPVVFSAVGAYLIAILCARFGVPTLAVMPIAVVVALALGYVLGLTTSRLSADHVVLSSLALCEVTRSILNNWDPVTNGSIGIMNIPPLIPAPDAGFQVVMNGTIALGCVTVACIHAFLLFQAPSGIVMRSLEDDALGSRSLGHNANRVRSKMVAIGAAWSAIAGMLIATHATYIDPSTFSMDEAIIVLAMLIIGGRTHPLGPLVGAGLFILLPEALRFIGLPPTIADPIRRVCLGAILLSVLYMRPNGLLR